MKKEKSGQKPLNVAEKVSKAGQSRRGKSSSTMKVYRAGWKDFTWWCQRHEVESLPARMDSLVDYLMERARDIAPSTLRGRVAAIKYYHEQAGLSSPTEEDAFQDFWAGLQEPAMHEMVAQVYEGDTPFHISERQKKLIPEGGEDLQTLRDRALILTGLYGDLSRHELTGIDREDITFGKGKARLHIRQTPGDALPRTVELKDQDDAHRPAHALRTWINNAQIQSGPVFRGLTRHGRLREQRLSDQSVSLIVKRAAEQAGLDPSTYSAEDLRQRPAK